MSDDIKRFYKVGGGDSRYDDNFKKIDWSKKKEDKKEDNNNKKEEGEEKCQD